MWWACRTLIGKLNLMGGVIMTNTRRCADTTHTQICDTSIALWDLLSHH